MLTDDAAVQVAARAPATIIILMNSLAASYCMGDLSILYGERNPFA